jgi:hypothetical protein
VVTAILHHLGASLVIGLVLATAVAVNEMVAE